MAKKFPASLLLQPGENMTGLSVARMLRANAEKGKETAKEAAKTEILNGRLLSDIVVATVSRRFDHGLGRQPVGWFIVDKTSALDVWRTDWDTRTISLDASASSTITIYVF